MWCKSKYFTSNLQVFYRQNTKLQSININSALYFNLILRQFFWGSARYYMILCGI